MTPTHEENANKWLMEAGLRPTRQRVTLAALLVGDDSTATNGGISSTPRRRGRRVAGHGLNTLRAFCDAGVLQEITVDGSKSYFDTNVHDHPHYYWEGEGRVSDAPSEELVIQSLPQPRRDGDCVGRCGDPPAQKAERS